MKDFQLYQQILGLAEPWTVKNVTLKPQEKEVEVEVVCTETMWGCPKCDERMHVHDWEQRSWRHLDSCQFKTVITADVPRVKCQQHGTQTVAVPWAERNSSSVSLKTLISSWTNNLLGSTGTPLPTMPRVKSSANSVLKPSWKLAADGCELSSPRSRC